jgi:4'-phosphopantetheinyl transferase
MPASAFDLSSGPAFRIVYAGQTDPSLPQSVLSPAEIAYFQRDRDPVRSLLRMRVRAALLNWLGECLNLAPDRVPLHQTASGRLELTPPYQDWTVSVSASREIGLLAVSQPSQGVVGVDVEWLDHAFDLSALGPPALSPAERAALDALPESSRRDAFFRLWTRKEAVAKALDLGVSAFDAGLDLSTLPLAETRDWRKFSALRQSLALRDLPIPAGYLAALAVVWPTK